MTLEQFRQLVANVKVLLRKRQYSTVLKYNPAQARNPAGSTGGGRWRSLGLAGRGLKDIDSRHREFPPVGTDRLARERQQAGFTEVAPGMERDLGRASYMDILDAPIGEGFKNTPRAVDLPEHLQPPTLSAIQQGMDSATVEALKTGTPTDSRPLGDGGNANASIIVTLDDPDSTEAVYKPERGENWTASFANHDIKKVITNRNFSLAEREAVAYEVDAALGLGLVPPTVLRETVDESNTSFDGSGTEPSAFDSDELQRMYDSYRQDAEENAMDEVGQEMGERYRDAQGEHVIEIEDRIEELKEIWDEELGDYLDVTEHGAKSVLRQHPTLPLGSEAFERREPKHIDPMDLIKGADIDVESPMTSREKDRAREAIRAAIAAGNIDIAELDKDAAKEHLDYDNWLEAHADTEGRLLNEKIQSFTDWKQSKGYSSGGGSGGGPDLGKNTQAPHPAGGSFQHFIEGSSMFGDLSEEDGARLAVLDYTIGTMDRHGRNLMYKDDRPVAIDNGYSMPAANNADDFQFRSDGVKRWLQDHGSIPDNVREQISEAFEKTDWLGMVARHPGMNKAEKESFLMRVGKMKKALKTQDGLRELYESSVEFMDPYGW